MILAPLDMSVRTSDGITLKGVLTYPTAAQRPFPLAVLAHQYPGTRDTFAPLIADLLALGIATLAFDERGHGASIVGADGRPVVVDTPEGFTSEAFGKAFMESASKVGFQKIDNDILRVASWGSAQNFIDSSRLLLVGASVGGSGVLLAAPTIAGLRGVLTVGAAGAPAFGADGPARVRAAIERLRVPVYLASSNDDAFDGAANAARWSDGLSHASTRIVPGAAHAMGIYFDVRTEVLDVVRGALA